MAGDLYLANGTKVHSSQPEAEDVVLTMSLVRSAKLRQALEYSVAFDRFLRLVQAGGIPNDSHAHMVLGRLYARYRDAACEVLEIQDWNEYSTPEYLIDKEGNLYEVEAPSA